MTDQPSFVLLPHRGVLAVAGADRKSFLQGLVSNDVTRVAPDRAIWAAFLTPQGKFVHDMVICERDDTLLLEVEADRLDDLRNSLKKYKLRAKVTLEARPDLTVAAVFGAPTPGFGLPPEAGAAAPFGDRGVVCVDPRLAEAGARLLLPAESAAATLEEAGLTAADPVAYDAHRLALGLPDGSRDLPVDGTFLMENGFEELHGVDFTKGCYIGQETTARMKHRGLVRKRLFPVRVEGPMPEPGTELTDDDGKTVGALRSGDAAAGLALAMVKLDALDGGPFTAGGASLTLIRPAWMRLPESA